MFKKWHSVALCMASVVGHAVTGAACGSPPLRIHSMADLTQVMSVTCMVDEACRMQFLGLSWARKSAGLGPRVCLCVACCPQHMLQRQALAHCGLLGCVVAVPTLLVAVPCDALDSSAHTVLEGGGYSFSYWDGAVPIVSYRSSVLHCTPFSLVGPAGLCSRLSL